MDCNELVELITDYLEEDLSPHAHARFEQHLKYCGGCAEYLAQMRVTIQLVGRTGLKPNQVPDALLEAFRDWCADEP